MQRGLVVVAALSITGCSFVLTKGPPKQPPPPSATAVEKQAKPDCTDEMTWPVIDVAFAGVSAVAIIAESGSLGAHKAAAVSQAILGAAAAVGAYVGHTRVQRCRAARAEWTIAQTQGVEPAPDNGIADSPDGTPRQPRAYMGVKTVGSEGASCDARGRCGVGLTCASNLCVVLPPRH